MSRQGHRPMPSSELKTLINPQEGWGIVESGHAVSLVHTSDGGKTWQEIKPVVVP